jgi:hypothetical protein
MTVVMQPSRIPAGDAVNVQNYPPAAAADFKKGRVLGLNASGEVIVHPLGGTVTGVLGIALEGTVAAGESSSPSGKVAVAKADRNQIFIGQLSDDGTVEPDVSQVDIGDEYGIELIDGVAYVNINDTTNELVQIIDRTEQLGLVLFKFIESALLAP